MDLRPGVRHASSTVRSKEGGGQTSTSPFVPFCIFSDILIDLAAPVVESAQGMFLTRTADQQRSHAQSPAGCRRCCRSMCTNYANVVPNNGSLKAYCGQSHRTRCSGGTSWLKHSSLQYSMLGCLTQRMSIEIDAFWRWPLSFEAVSLSKMHPCTPCRVPAGSTWRPVGTLLCCCWLRWCWLPSEWLMQAAAACICRVLNQHSAKMSISKCYLCKHCTYLKHPRRASPAPASLCRVAVHATC